MAWFQRRNRRELFLSATTLAEIRRGIALIARRDSEQGDHLRAWCDRLRLISTRIIGEHPVQTAEKSLKEYDAPQAAGKK